MKISGSFRDPSGFLYMKDGHLFREVNLSYKDNFDLLLNSGLYDDLTRAGLLVPHEEVSVETALSMNAYKVLKPEIVPFISYPYEWCFGQLKAAALATLDIQKKALGRGLSLKDASAYNIQFLNCRPVLIDTLSFEKYEEGSPWIAYRQFCQHLLAPIALMSRKDARLQQLSRIHLDGIPLDLASALLPFRTRINTGLLMHIHLHARSQRRFRDKPAVTGQIKAGRYGLSGIIDSLQTLIQNLAWQPEGSEWEHYYGETNYPNESFQHKVALVGDFLASTDSATVWDMGANTGVFSRIADNMKKYTVSFDLDHACVEKNYQDCLQERRTGILPLVMDLTNPSPGIGWDNTERSSLAVRGPADVVLALALIHHLAISHNLPLEKVASFLAGLCQFLIIEFVPKTDSQVQRLLATRKDIFPEYAEACFEHEFRKYFEILKASSIHGTERTLYLMRKI